MTAHRDDEDGELIRCTPGGWWLGDERLAGTTCLFFLRHGLISKDSYSDRETFEIYRANEFADLALNDPDFHPFQRIQ